MILFIAGTLPLCSHKKKYHLFLMLYLEFSLLKDKVRFCGL